LFFVLKAKRWALLTVCVFRLLKSRETQGLVPVTVKQISEASQTGDEKSNFVINGVDLNNVCLALLLVSFEYFFFQFIKNWYAVLFCLLHSEENI